MNFCIKYLSACLILTGYVLVSCREISRSSSSPTACNCPSSDSCSEDETLLLALGAILGYILTQMTPSMHVLSLLFPIGLPTVGRTNLHFAMKQEPEAMAKALNLGIESFCKVIKRPICAENYLCLANQRWKNTHKFDSVLQILGSVAGQITIRNVIELSESTLHFLAFKNSTNCNVKKHPSCFAKVGYLLNGGVATVVLPLIVAPGNQVNAIIFHVQAVGISAAPIAEAQMSWPAIQV